MRRNPGVSSWERPFIILKNSGHHRCVTPAMEAGITDYVWRLEEVLGLQGISVKIAA